MQNKNKFIYFCFALLTMLIMITGILLACNNESPSTGNPTDNKDYLTVTIKKEEDATFTEVTNKDYLITKDDTYIIQYKSNKDIAVSINGNKDNVNEKETTKGTITISLKTEPTNNTQFTVSLSSLDNSLQRHVNFVETTINKDYLTVTIKKESDTTFTEVTDKDYQITKDDTYIIQYKSNKDIAVSINGNKDNVNEEETIKGTITISLKTESTNNIQFIVILSSLDNSLQKNINFLEIPGISFNVIVSKGDNPDPIIQDIYEIKLGDIYKINVKTNLNNISCDKDPNSDTTNIRIDKYGANTFDISLINEPSTESNFNIWIHTSSEAYSRKISFKQIKSTIPQDVFDVTVNKKGETPTIQDIYNIKYNEIYELTVKTKLNFIYELMGESDRRVAINLNNNIYTVSLKSDGEFDLDYVWKTILEIITLMLKLIKKVTVL